MTEEGVNVPDDALLAVDCDAFCNAFAAEPDACLAFCVVESSDTDLLDKAGR